MFSHHRKEYNIEKRKFKCGCGKAYLSYPALYTHIKINHGGIVIPGTNFEKSFNSNLLGSQKKSTELK